MIFSQPDIKKQNETLVALSVIDVIHETEDVRTFRLDNSDGFLANHKPGMFVKVCLDINGNEVWRSFTISSSPRKSDRIDLTIKRNYSGEVGNYFFNHIIPGSKIKIKGPLGQFFFDDQLHTEPVVLLCAGIGITPMMSILRFLSESNSHGDCVLFYGARTYPETIFDSKIRKLSTSMPGFQYYLTLSQPSPQWLGYCGQLNFDFIQAKISQPLDARFFLCGPRQFNQEFEKQLLSAGVSQSLIHSEQFHKNENRNKQI